MTMAPGTALSLENLGEIDWPEGVPLPGAISKREDVAGKTLSVGIGQNEPLLERHLAAANSSMGLAAKIPDGMRATAVRTNEVNNLAGFLFPGARVDVLVTFRADNNRTFTRTVLQNVQILSTGSKIEADPQGKPENVAVVTLLLTPAESQKIVLAENQGSLQFVLRNGGDSASPDVPTVDVAELQGAPRKIPEPTRTSSGGRRIAPKRIEVFTVETVAGGKTTVAKFPEREN
jgi:pilus assembly protein CpaB